MEPEKTSIIQLNTALHYSEVDIPFKKIDECEDKLWWFES